LFQLTSNMEQSAKTSMELLLMMDREDKRTVNYEQFGRLMMNIVATFGSDKTFDQVADELVMALTTNTTISEQDMTSLIVADAVYADFQTQQIEQHATTPDLHHQENDSAVSFGRLQKLFELFDVNNDGGIDYDEMEDGLTQYEKSAGLSNNLQGLLHAQFEGKQFDEGLNKQEFARVMHMYSDQFGVDLHQLIDFMCLTAVLPRDRAEQYTQAYQQTFAIKDKKKARKQTATATAAQDKIMFADDLNMDFGDFEDFE